MDLAGFFVEYEAGRPLLSPDEVRRLPDGEALIYGCAAQFPDTSAFAGAPTTVTFTASIKAVSGKAPVALVLEADPYEDDGPTWWLSDDLRVFQVSGTNPSLPAVPTVTLPDTGDPTNDAPNFINALIAAFNGNTTPPPNHPFDTISTLSVVKSLTG